MSIFEYDEESHMKLVREEGLEEGLEEGRMEGQLAKTIDLITRKMKSSGMSFEDVCTLFELTAEEISACRDRMEK